MPLTFDLPLEQLYTYPGSSSRPAGFDAFWQRALDELDGVDPQVELVPAAFQAPFAGCFDLFFSGVGGARIHAKYLRPTRSDEPRPAVLQFHGYNMSAGDWVEKLPYPAAGIHLAAMDCRGQGTSLDPGQPTTWTLGGHIVRGLDGPPEHLSFRQIFLDTVQLARVVMRLPGVDPDRLGAFGGSQGGGLTLACAALEPRIRRLVTIHPFLSDYKRVWAMDLAKDAYSELKEYFRKYDPKHQREEELFEKLGYVDVQHLAPRIRGQVRMVTGLMDTICPPSTQFAAYNKITAKKEVVLYPDYGHEVVPGVYDEVFQFLSGL